jgi:hypothetical protein
MPARTALNRFIGRMFDSRAFWVFVAIALTGDAIAVTVVWYYLGFDWALFTASAITTGAAIIIGIGVGLVALALHFGAQACERSLPCEQY